MHNEGVLEERENNSLGPLCPEVPGMPDFGSLSFEDAIRLFKQWGFQVEPGPRAEEVTLIVEGPDFRTCSVHDARALPAMAAVGLRVRWQNGMLTGQRVQKEQSCNTRYLGAELMC